MDQEFLQKGREHIRRFLERMAARLSGESGRPLEIGPRDRSEVRERFGNYVIDMLDIVATHASTYVGDITKHNAVQADDSYHGVVCMEVLEHTLDPFGAVGEVRRLLKHGGFLLTGAPLNFRIRGPIPDCWRFTEHGFRVLLRDFEILEIDILETPGRRLFPLRYNVLARNDRHRHTAEADLAFRFID
jgi:SAM-dependent methyltransferase